MLNRVVLFCVTSCVSLAALTAVSTVHAADWPEVKTSVKNPLPECATPGRMMALVKARNASLDPRFATIAAEYQRHGEQLGMRWDYAFFQMLAETGNLSFKSGARQGIVKADQNNFAGLGAVSASETGESFADVSTGARAHLEHVLIYAGERVANPVAERTRKVQDWGVVPARAKSSKGAASFGDVLAKWAPKAKPYADAVEASAATFYDTLCATPDPSADRIAASPIAAPAAVVAAKAEPVAKVSGTDLAKRAIEDGKVDGNSVRAGLGSGFAKGLPTVKVLNAPDAPAAVPPTSTITPPIQPVAAAGAAALPSLAQLAKPAAGQKCRVWTASYGGEKALIIRSITGDVLNFTVLDVNPGQEAREADAYIAAYARDGKVAAEFQNQTQALDKAFELCPEG